MLYEAAVTTKARPAPLPVRPQSGRQTGPAHSGLRRADSRGRPLAFQAYAGNTGDPTTVPDQVEKVRDRFGLKRVVLVGDRGC